MTPALKRRGDCAMGVQVDEWLPRLGKKECGSSIGPQRMSRLGAQGRGVEGHSEEREQPEQRQRQGRGNYTVSAFVELRICLGEVGWAAGPGPGMAGRGVRTSSCSLEEPLTGLVGQGGWHVRALCLPFRCI